MWRVRSMLSQTFTQTEIFGSYGVKTQSRNGVTKSVPSRTVHSSGTKIDMFIFLKLLLRQNVVCLTSASNVANGLS